MMMNEQGDDPSEEHAGVLEGAVQPPGLPDELPEFERFQTSENFARLVCACIVDACAHGANTLILCDTDFSGWPLSNAEVIEALQGWAHSTSNQRLLTVVAANYRAIERRHGTWAHWRKTWDHRVQCLQYNADPVPELPGVFWCERSVLLIQDAERCGGIMTRTRQRIVREKSRLDEIIRQGSAAFPATTLGL